MSREEAEWQSDGSRETRDFLQPILTAQCGVVGAKNLFVGGWSQGCAIALDLFASWQGVDDGGLEEGAKQGLGDFIGMIG